MLLSVIIPTLNEAAVLEKAVRAVKSRAAAADKKEIIVVDSGSRDGTEGIARRLGVLFIQASASPKGRGFALNAAARRASGDVLFFLDADSIPPQDYDELIEEAMKDEKTAGGAFEFALDGKEPALRAVEAVNRLRYRIWPRYYGDQGIFARRDAFERAGGYSERFLMEASHFCLALRREGKLVLIKKRLLTSPRRFLQGGIFRVLARDSEIFFLDLFGFSTEHSGRAYWQENEERGGPEWKGLK